MDTDVRFRVCEALNLIVQDSHETAQEKGWWIGNDHNFAEKVALVHAEVSEALEAFRDGEPVDTIIVDGGKPEGVAVEFADVIIRIADICGKWRIPLAEAFQLKAKYNKQRSFRHGGKRI